MKKILSLTAVVIVAIAASALAAVTPELDLAKGPEQFLMTKEDVAAWKSVRSDADAKAFADLFWARRDPTPATQQNEFHLEFDRRVKYADEHFGTKKLRGAVTDRGKALILYGVPTKVERVSERPAGPAGNDESMPSTTGVQGQLWTYEGDAAKVFGAQKATIRFVDRYSSGDFRADRTGTADLAVAQQTAMTAALTQPGLKAVPTYAPPPPPAPVLLSELPTESLRTAVAEFKAAAKNPYEGQAFASWGEFVTAGGETFVPVMLYLPAPKTITAAQNLTFFGVVQDASGANVVAFEEPAKLASSKDDLFVDRTLLVGSGKHRAYIGLADAGKPVTMAAVDLDLNGKLDKDAPAVSSLILSNNVYPLKEAQRADDPFAFGGVKVIPKADHRFRSTDELWYFFEMRNPGIPEAVAPAADPAAATADAAAAPAPAAPAEEALPKLQVKVDVEGVIAGGQKVKKSAPPMEIQAIPMKGVPGHYGVGNAIPLASFKPGDYTFTVKVIDTVKKSSYTLTDKFTITE